MTGTARAICPACETVVLPDVLVLRDMHLRSTRTGDRRIWTHQTFGVIHLCDRGARAAVRRRTGVRCSNPAWLAFLWRHRRLRPLAKLIQPTTPLFPALLTFETYGRGGGGGGGGGVSPDYREEWRP